MRKKKIQVEVVPPESGLVTRIDAASLHGMAASFRARAAEHVLPQVLKLLKSSAARGHFTAPVSLEGLKGDDAICVLEAIREPLIRLGFIVGPGAVRYQKQWGAWSSETIDAPALLVSWEVLP